MLSRFFAKKPSAARSNSSSHKQQLSLSSIEDKGAQIKALTGSERQLYSYEKPTQEMGLTDLLKQHEPGSRFMYAAVTGKEEEDSESRQHKLRNWKPNLRKTVESIDNLPNLKLYKEVEVFPIKPLIDALTSSKKTKSAIGDFFRVVEAMVIYGAIVSPDCNFTRVKVALVDNRLMEFNEAKSFIADTNKEARGDLRMPYCIPTENADLLSLVVSRENQFLVDGLMWGVIKVKLSLEFCDFPKQYDNTEVAAMNMITASALGERVVDPDTINISITNNDRKQLTQLYASGDLVDTEVPMKNRTSLKSAKSSVREMAKVDNKHFGEGWGDMSIPRQEVNDASTEPDEDISDTQSDIDRRNELKRIAILNQEALRSQYASKIESQKESLKGEVEEIRSNSPEAKAVKRVGFEDSINLFD